MRTTILRVLFIGLLIVTLILAACSGGSTTTTTVPTTTIQPPSFSLSNLIIEPTKVALNEEVKVSVSVANTGNSEGIHDVVLKINGAEEETRRPKIGAGDSKKITFRVAREDIGTYAITIEDLSGSFTVTLPQTETSPPPITTTTTTTTTTPMTTTAPQATTNTTPPITTSPPTTTTPLAPTTTSTPTPTQIEASDGQVTIILEELARANTLPTNILETMLETNSQFKAPQLTEGSEYVCVYLTINSIENIHLTNALGYEDEKTVLLDAKSNKYKLLFGHMDGVRFSDPEDIAGTMEFVEGAAGFLVFEVPKVKEITEIQFVYSFKETWEEESTKRGQIDANLTQLPLTITTTPAEGPSMAGEWVATITIGEIWFIVNESGTSIAEVGIRIPGEFSCGNSTTTGTELSVEYMKNLPTITGMQFTVSWTIRSSGWLIEIEGSFDLTGMQASGTWQISSGGTTCDSGTWTSTRE